MRRFRLLVDVDEVLGDFQTPAFDIIYDLTSRRYKPEDFEVWDMFEAFEKPLQEMIFAEIDRPGWCFSIQPFEAAQKAIQEIRDLGVDVYALTSPHHSQTWYYERVEWLKKHYGMTKHQVIQTPAKYLVRGDAFIDDNPTHVTNWRREHPEGAAMLWHIPNTRNLGMEDVRVRSWDEVKVRVQGLLDARA